ncbi:porin family protein [Cardinium endosymbiont of Oedothorax gibbosus]|uniref:porin family protein n=1 Tax=Cardinium endosymbiont of Oedothorax gibbosus TaxID=931101 RepID=UPI00202534D7|nr:porin family protein [Cardinium endosymbiont of Oedothorax gibbosus]CAH2559928.1 Outer membrane protein beta-barrel domain-containing protein [Cardinium endosymbiont of Oedothorax gibbosus]
MKGIKKTLMAGVLACATFNAHAEVSPWGFGVKGYGGVSSAVRYSEKAKIDNKQAESDFFSNGTFGGHVYGEYAFTNIFGVGLEGGYMMQKITFTGKTKEKENKDEKNNTASMTSHSIAIGPYLCAYPLGREEEQGILKIMLGAYPYFPLKSTRKEGSQEEDIKNDPKPSYDIALAGAVAYEFPFGLSLEAKYSHGLMNRFKTEKNQDQAILKTVNHLKEAHVQHATIGIGYNFASLLCE